MVTLEPDLNDNANPPDIWFRLAFSLGDSEDPPYIRPEVERLPGEGDVGAVLILGDRLQSGSLHEHLLYWLNLLIKFNVLHLEGLIVLEGYHSLRELL